MLSNIAAGTEEHIWSLFQAQKQSGLVKTLIRMATSSETMSVRKEALWAICNIVTTGTTSQYQYMIELDVLDPLCDILTYRDDSKLLLIVLEALENILIKNEENGTSHAQTIEEYQGLDALESLQDHPSNEVYMKAVSILERFFGGAEEEEDQNIMPSSDANCFEFSVPKELFPPESNSNSSSSNTNFKKADHLFHQQKSYNQQQNTQFHFGSDNGMNIGVSQQR
jgi:importin subunit alpha-6/7